LRRLGRLPGARSAGPTAFLRSATLMSWLSATRTLASVTSYWRISLCLACAFTCRASWSSASLCPSAGFSPGSSPTPQASCRPSRLHSSFSLRRAPPRRCQPAFELVASGELTGMLARRVRTDGFVDPASPMPVFAFPAASHISPQCLVCSLPLGCRASSDSYNVQSSKLCYSGALASGLRVQHEYIFADSRCGILSRNHVHSCTICSSNSGNLGAHLNKRRALGGAQK
jgi:hypothetical protein